MNTFSAENPATALKNMNYWIKLLCCRTTVYQSFQCFWNPDFFRTLLLRKLVMNTSSPLEILKLLLSFSLVWYICQTWQSSVFCFLFNCKIKNWKKKSDFSFQYDSHWQYIKNQHYVQVVLQMTNFYQYSSKVA